MAYTIDYGYTRSEATKQITVAKPDYANWTVSLETTRSQGTDQLTREFTNLTSPMDRVAELRIWNKGVKDIYASSSVNPANQSPVHTGMILGCMQNSTLMITEETESLSSSQCCEKPVYAPIQFTGTLRVLKHPGITPDVMRQYLLDCINKWFPEDDVTSDQINNWSKGALNLLS